MILLQIPIQLVCTQNLGNANKLKHKTNYQITEHRTHCEPVRMLGQGLEDSISLDLQGR